MLTAYIVVLVVLMVAICLIVYFGVSLYSGIAVVCVCFMSSALCLVGCCVLVVFAPGYQRYNNAKRLYEKYNGEVPQTREELIALPGVGRKTANVVLGEAFHVPALAVDTHVERVSKRLAIVKSEANVSEVEETLMKKIPKNKWVQTHHTLIFFGRYHCTAKNPKCDQCPVLQYCKEGKKRLGIK